MIAWSFLMGMYVLNLVLTPFVVGRKREPMTPLVGVFTCVWGLILMGILWTLKP